MGLPAIYLYSTRFLIISSFRPYLKHHFFSSMRQCSRHYHTLARLMLSVMYARYGRLLLLMDSGSIPHGFYLMYDRLLQSSLHCWLLVVPISYKTNIDYHSFLSIYYATHFYQFLMTKAIVNFGIVCLAISDNHNVEMSMFEMYLNDCPKSTLAWRTFGLQIRNASDCVTRETSNNLIHVHNSHCRMPD